MGELSIRARAEPPRVPAPTSAGGRVRV